MNAKVQTAIPSPARRLDDRTFDALAAALAFLSYFAVFLAVRSHRGMADAALSSLINLVPLVVLTAAVRAILRRHVVGTPPRGQVGMHLALATGFTLSWHWLLMVLMGIRDGGSFTQFDVRAFFPGPVVAWQLLQGIAVYALIATLTDLRAQRELPSLLVSPSGGGEAKESALTRYFIRRGDELYPLDVSQIVSIAGADDYAEVATLGGRHLVRSTLAEFEATLDQVDFLRVHRSRIVNLRRVVRAEPSGDGRMLLHMEDGEAIQSSRSGARLFRERVS
ncbi:MAG TPA: LytTR family DNA-binding domain-containing protein [Allosphingosinicella sp.]|jgi:hypothetical protein|nr:LytTR family DNA-binding domain-containing protein [Allosphingosinicella sp.]